MKGFVLGFITAVLVIFGGFMLMEDAGLQKIAEAAEETELEESFDEFVEAGYDFVNELFED